MTRREDFLKWFYTEQAGKGESRCETGWAAWNAALESQAGKLTEAAALLEELGRLCSNAGGQLLKDAARDAVKLASRLRHE
jgi:hypothetical protein